MMHSFCWGVRCRSLYGCVSSLNENISFVKSKPPPFSTACPSSKLSCLVSAMSWMTARAASRTSTAPATTDSPRQNRRPKTASSTRATCCTSSTPSQTWRPRFSIRSVEGGNQYGCEFLLKASTSFSCGNKAVPDDKCCVLCRFVKRSVSRAPSMLKCSQERVSCIDSAYWDRLFSLEINT